MYITYHVYYNCRNAYSMYKTAVQKEVEAEMGESGVKTWVCMCTLRIGKDGEVTRVLPERMRYAHSYVDMYIYVHV